MEEDTSDPMFVIKNLDTGLQMRIDDFNKIANLAADEKQEQEHPQKKGGLNFKGTKAIKNWTAATTKKASAAAKKAVSGIKDVAQELKHELKHELNSPYLLTKHKSAYTSEPSTCKPASSIGALPSAAGNDDILLQRSPAAETLDSVVGQSAASSTSLAASEQLTDSNQTIQPSHQAAQTAGTSDVSASVPDLELTGPLITAGIGATAAPPPSGQPAVLSTAAAAAGATPAAASAASAPSGPAVPAAVRLVSHKRCSHAVREVVLAQVLEGSAGVVWATAFSRDGSFLATAGQDGVLRVWQLTSSRDKQPCTNWSYSAPAPTECKSISSDTGSVQTQEQQQQQQQLQQQDDNATSDCQQLSHNATKAAGEAAQQQQQSQATINESTHPAQQQNNSEPQHNVHEDCSSHSMVQQLHGQHWQQQAETPQEQPAVKDFGPYFSSQPVRVFLGHSEDILDVSWSSGGFILTASLDKSVRLWHVSQPDCLREFWHTDFVTSVQFHPLDAQRFVSGSIDGKIRVWSITENAVLATAQLHQDMVTAVAFSLNGGRVMAGTMRGRCRFYELADRKLEYVAQVDVRNQRGAHAGGKKVTGICAVPAHPHQFLVTTNDSRLRLLEGYGQVLKFKGHKNVCTQSRASINADGVDVACGSDDGWVYVWQTGAQDGGHMAATGTGHQQHRAPAGTQQQQQQTGGKNALYQAYQAHELGVPVTAVAFAPTTAYQGQVSVLSSNQAGSLLAPVGGGISSAITENTASDGQLAAVAQSAVVAVQSAGGSRKVQQLVVSGAFNGSVRVHELL